MMIFNRQFFLSCGCGIAVGFLAGCKGPEHSPGKSATLEEFQRRAQRFNSQIRLPEFETSPGAVYQSVSNTITRANAALDDVGARGLLAAERLTFDNTIRALDDIGYGVGTTANRLSLIKETSRNAALRDAATEATKTLSAWAVGLDYREDVYRAVKRYAAKKANLVGEEAKLLAETLRDYKRAGLELPKAQRDEVEQMRKQLTGLTTDFESNITKAKKALKFSRAELEGVPDNFLSGEGIKTGGDEYTVMANITFHRTIVMENAKLEATRRKFFTEYCNLARAENVPLLQQILELRHTIAKKLGYASWADYQIEPKMAKTGAKALKFLTDLKTGLQPKFEAELAEFRAMKATETGDANVSINVWDTGYYSNQLKKEKYTVDAEALRVYFPYDRTLQGMFDIYQRIFGIRIEEAVAPYKWVEDLKLFMVSDAQSREPLGLFYLDMFPREGKYNHFAQFGIIEGKRLADNRYQRPTVALVCNFPTPQKGQPSLLSHYEVQTLFHEFGHALHSILTRANFARFAGTSVPRDFVEAPSQMLENWAWDKRVLDSFAADYRDPSKKIPQEILKQLKAAKLATVATYYRRQLSFGLLDLTLHSQVREGVDCLKLSNKVLGEVLLPMPEDSAFIAYFGHLMGYDASYYGYAWADAIAADMATVFEKSKGGYYDEATGRRLRNEVYARGDSREVNVSIQKFLGRPQSLEPFLKTLGLGKK